MDTLGNLLTSIRNAYLAHRETTLVPASRLSLQVVNILKREGYLADVNPETTPSGRRMLRLTLRYTNREPAIAQIRRISSPGRRVYAPAKTIPRPKLGFGIMILSTSSGILTDREARQQRVGGEVLAEVIAGAGR